MSVYLLDANVMIALAIEEHESHGAARTWVADVPGVAVCPIVEGALARTLIRLGESPPAVSAVVQGFRKRPGLEFWPDDVSYADIDLSGVRGHRQVTDGYLVALARARGGVLATFDTALVASAAGAAILIPGGPARSLERDSSPRWTVGT